MWKRKDFGKGAGFFNLTRRFPYSNRYGVGGRKSISTKGKRCGEKKTKDGDSPLVSLKSVNVLPRVSA